MKAKMIIILSVCCLFLVACGGNEEQSNTPAENASIEESEKTVVEDTKEIEETVEQVPELETDTVDELEGDVDVTSGELTMDDMQELVVGLDTPVIIMDEGSNTYFSDFSILFPGSAYITDYTDGGMRAELEEINFNIQVIVQNGEPSNNVREDMGESQETVGNYVIDVKAGRNDKYSFQTSYYVCDTTNGVILRVSLTINKNEAYQEYCDSLVEEFVPAFEQTLKANLQ